MNSRLPRDTTGSLLLTPVCPWCQTSVDDATVCLSDLDHAWKAGALQYAPRASDGTADVDALSSQCGECQRPFIIALGKKGMRLLAVRTAADVALLGGVA